MGKNAAVLKLVTDAEQETKSIDIVTVKRMLDEKEDFKLVDIREGNEWQLDHLPNAIHIPRGILEFVIDQAVPKLDRKIVLYCGRGARGALAAVNLQQLGYSNVFNMKDGYLGWKAQSFPLVRD